jgi:hypothetical protein
LLYKEEITKKKNSQQFFKLIKKIAMQAMMCARAWRVNLGANEVAAGPDGGRCYLPYYY